MNCNQMTTEEIPWGQIADVKAKPCPKCGVAAEKFTEYLNANHARATTEIQQLAEAITKLATAIEGNKFKNNKGDI